MELNKETLWDDAKPFQNSQGHRIADVVTFVENWKNTHRNGRVFVGTDSKVKGAFVKYSTVICLWDVGKGVKEVYRNFIFKNPKDRFSRLWNEVMMSVQVAEKLQHLGAIHVHMDYNSNPNFPSYSLYDAGMGLVNSMGFIGAGKPLSWAATSGANRRCQ
jgi:predicted RNase H-related nuclease YkuK (DUF458 family)